MEIVLTSVFPAYSLAKENKWI